MIQEEMVFPSAVSRSSGIVITVFGTALAFLSLFLWFEIGTEPEAIVVTLLLTAVCITFFWMLFDTKYVIKGELLYYNSGPIRGKINIMKIRKIEHQKGWYQKSLMKPALSINGLYLYYDKFEDIYISPKDKTEFVNYLLKINPKIELI
jgi:hypothetical protein